MFIKLTRISHNGVDNTEYERETIINTDDITSVKEMVKGTPLYDIDGNLQKFEENTTKTYHVYVKNGPRIVLNEKGYNELVKKLDNRIID